MATYTAQQMLGFYMEAEVALLQGKSVRFNDGAVDRMVTMEDLDWIQRGRREWQGKVDTAAARASRAPTIGGLAYSVARMDGH